ncbi:AAA family ATPase [Paenibacillus sp. Marseille-Q7038]
MLTRIKIVNLFGFHNHDFDVTNNMERNVVILHGPNGSGKTTIFKMLQSLSKQQFEIFFNTHLISFMFILMNLVTFALIKKLKKSLFSLTRMVIILNIRRNQSELKENLILRIDGNILIEYCTVMELYGLEQVDMSMRVKLITTQNYVVYWALILKI